MEKIFNAHVHTYPLSLAPKATLNPGAFYNFRVIHESTAEDLRRTSQIKL